MTTKGKTIWACICYAVCAFLLVRNQEWMALIWCILACVQCALVILQDAANKRLSRLVEQQRKTIYNKNRMLTIAYGKNEALLANCKRYQEELKRLRTYENTDKRGTEEAGQRNDEGESSL